MRTKLINKNIVPSDGYGAGSGTIEKYEYECPCGNGRIVEEYDNIPGFKEHSLSIECEECNKKYEFDISKGKSNWELVEQ